MIQFCFPTAHRFTFLSSPPVTRTRPDLWPNARQLTFGVWATNSSVPEKKSVYLIYILCTYAYWFIRDADEKMQCKRCYNANKWIIFINVDLFTNMRIISFSFFMLKKINLLTQQVIIIWDRVCVCVCVYKHTHTISTKNLQYINYRFLVLAVYSGTWSKSFRSQTD